MLLELSIHKKVIYIFALLSLLAPQLVSAEEEEHVVDPKSAGFWGQIIAILCLVSLSGVVAGLTLGLMSLDATNLAILEIAGTPQQKEHASRILPIRKNGHILLATLLLTNTVLNETLPILFDDIFSKGFISVIVSTALLVLFAEIIPQAVFSKHGLAIGAMFVFPVRILIGIWFVISWPISKFLDSLLGKHTGFIYGVAEFDALFQLHNVSQAKEGTLKPETVTVLRNVLEMQDAPISQLVNPISSMLILPDSALLSTSIISQYIDIGHSHLFVSAGGLKENGCEDARDYHEIAGVLELKSLLRLDSRAFIEPIGTMKLDPCLTLPSSTPIIEAMNKMLQVDTFSQFVLVQHTDEDVQLAKQKQDEEQHNLAMAKAIAISKHSKNIKCTLRRMISSVCPVCRDLQSEETAADEDTIGSSTPSTINVTLESGLLGMVTITDILNQITHIRHNPNCIEQQDGIHSKACS